MNKKLLINSLYIIGGGLMLLDIFLPGQGAMVGIWFWLGMLVAAVAMLMQGNLDKKGEE